MIDSAFKCGHTFMLIYCVLIQITNGLKILQITDAALPSRKIV